MKRLLRAVGNVCSLTGRNVQQGLSNALKGTPAKKRRNRRRALAVEEFESRVLLSRMIVLDFDGATEAEERLALTRLPPGWHPAAEATAQLSFVGEFATLHTEYGGYSRYNFLDLNEDGRLDRMDGDIAAGRIMSKVYERFRTYDARVIRTDGTSEALALMNDGVPGDTLIFVTGTHEGSGGRAPLDPGNTQDDVAVAGYSVGMARLLADNGWTGPTAREAFLNGIANLIAHEVGHTFGLEHVDVGAHPDAVSLMTPEQGVGDVGFPDVEYRVSGGGLQNAHRELLQILRGRWQPLGGSLVSMVSGRDPDTGRLQLFGIAPDGSTWVDTHTGGDRWTGWQPLGGVLSSILATRNVATGRLQLFGIAPDGTTWVNTHTGGSSWTGWQPLGGVLASVVTALNPDTGRTQLFGIAPDGTTWVNTHTADDSWTGWQELGGVLSSMTTAHNGATGRLQLFGIAPDGSSFVNTHVDDHWTGWQPLGGVLTSLLPANNPATGRLQLFGIAPDGTTWVNTHTADDSWTGWQELGGVLASMTATYSLALGRVQLFGIAPDGTTWVNTHITDDRWSGWQPLEGVLASMVATRFSSTGEVQLFGVAPDGTTWMDTHSGDHWSGWRELGGVLASMIAAPSSEGLMIAGLALDGTVWRMWA